MTGKTLARLLAGTRPDSKAQAKRHFLNKLTKMDRCLIIVKRRSRTRGYGRRVYRKDRTFLSRGDSRVFDCEELALKAIRDGKVQKANEILLRYEGPERRVRHAQAAFARLRRCGRGFGRRRGTITIDPSTSRSEKPGCTSRGRDSIVALSLAPVQAV
ncbi:protein of unknown function [Methylocaldum szegediense]|uniref:Uncharacterized protein n=1 Tax=Methylocaldum szegediense TaxID=73780 RepID=A0ABN8X809_9GAMM|nr:protein of unknown function [Methylocaldum szegediense]